MESIPRTTSRKIIAWIVTFAMIFTMSMPSLTWASDGSGEGGSGTTETQAPAGAVAAITEGEETSYFNSLAEAIVSIKTNDKTTITLVDDAVGGVKIGGDGNGVITPRNIVLDLAGHTYDVREAVGSTGTETNGIQLIKGSTVVIKNGTMEASEGSNVATMIKNYCDLTLEDLTVKGMVNNCGQLTVNGKNTNISNGDDWAITTGNYEHGDIITTTINAGTISSVACETPLWETGKAETKATVDESVTTTINGGTIGKVGAYDWRSDYGDKYKDAPMLTNWQFIINDGATVSENEFTAQVGNHYYDSLSLQRAADALQSGDTLKLLKDVTSRVNIDGTADGLKNITLDLNGNSIKVADDSALAIGYGKDNAEVKTKADVTIKNGTIEGNPAGIIVKNGTANIEDGVTIKGTEYGVSGNGLYNQGTVINIKGGTIEATEAESAAVYHPQKGTLNITGGTLKGATGIQLCSGDAEVNMKAGTIEATGEDLREGKTGDGLISDGSAISVVNRNYPGGEPTANIEGGTFTAEVDDVIAAYTWESNAESPWENATKNVVVTGGTFSASPSTYVPKDYKVVQEETSYKVVGKEYVVQIEENKYESITDAVAALESGQTLKLLSDLEDSLYKAYKSESIDELTIDLNGHKIVPAGNGSAGINIREVAKLTIKDSSEEKTGAIETNNGFGILFWGTELILQDNIALSTGEKAQINVPSGYTKINADAEYTCADARYFTKDASGNQYYCSSACLGNAVDIAEGTRAIKLLKDETSLIGGSGKYILDLNGHTVNYTKTSDAAMVMLHATSDITVTNSKEEGGIKTTSTPAFLIYKGKLTLENVKIEAGTYGISGNGSESSDTEIVINEGTEITVTGDDGAAIYHPHDGKLTINGGKLTGPVGVQMCAGDLILNGGIITATKGDARESKTGDGVILDGSAVSVVNRNYPGGTPSVQIKTGEITSQQGKAVSAYTWANDEAAGWTEAKDFITITGGTFNTDPSDYVPETYAATLNGSDTYTVAKRTEGEASIGDTFYKTFEKALSDAEESQTVTLQKNIERTESIVIDSGKTFTLDLNGKTITNNNTERGLDATTIQVKDGTKLTVTDGTVQAEYNEANANDYEGGKIISDADNGIRVFGECDSSKWSTPVESTLTVKGGFIAGQEYGIGIYGNGAVLNMDSGYIYSNDNAAIGGNGTCNSIENKGGTTINIKGGVLGGDIESDGYVSCGIYHPQSGELNVTGGTIISLEGPGIVMRNGKLNFSEGVIRAEGGIDLSGKVGDRNYDLIASGIIIDYAEKYNYNNDPNDTRAVSITGGTIKSEECMGINVIKEEGNKTDDIVITGGTFSMNPVPYVPKETHVVSKDEAGTFTVLKKTDVVAFIEDTYYKTFDEAVAALETGDTLTLLKDVTSRVNIKGTEAGLKNITLDLNGNSIKVADDSALAIGYGKDNAEVKTKADVTIKNGTIEATGEYGHEYAGVIVKNGTLTVEDGVTIKGTEYGISGNGLYNQGTVINVKGGTIEATAREKDQHSVAVYHPQKGTLNITGGTLKGATGIQLCSGDAEVNMEAGKIEATGEDLRSIKTGDGIISDGAAISVVDRNYPGEEPKVNVSGGTFTAAVDYVIVAYGWTNSNEPTEATVWENATKNVVVTGGTFSADPSEYVDKKYVAVEKDGIYTIENAVTDIELNETEAIILTGETLELNATVSPMDAYYKNVEWSSSDENVATVSKDGTVTAVAKGTVEITATAHNGVKAVCEVTVEKSVTDIELNETEVMILKGETFELKATVSPSDAYYKEIEWSSSDDKVATVSEDGTVTAVSKGTVEITATAHNGVKAVCDVTVENAVTSVELDKTRVALLRGETLQLNAFVLPTDAYHQEIEWSSSDDKVATVSEDGTVTAVAKGTAEIIVKSHNGMKEICYVTVTTGDNGAKIGKEMYDTFEEALEAAKNGDTIEILKDVTVTAPFSINKNLKIVGAENVEVNVPADRLAKLDSVFQVEDGKKLSVENIKFFISSQVTNLVNNSQGGALTFTNNTVIVDGTDITVAGSIDTVFKGVKEGSVISGNEIAAPQDSEESKVMSIANTEKSGEKIVIKDNRFSNFDIGISFEDMTTEELKATALEIKKNIFFNNGFEAEISAEQKAMAGGDYKLDLSENYANKDEGDLEGRILKICDGDKEQTEDLDWVVLNPYYADYDMKKAVSEITGITLNTASAQAVEGDKIQLIAAVAPENAYDKSATWTTSDEAVASVDNGFVTVKGRRKCNYHSRNSRR